MDESYNGVSNNQVGWWKITRGQVDFNYTGLAANQNGWWMCRNGQVDFNYNGIVPNENGYWKVENGQVNFNFNGIANNENGWWKFWHGKVDFSYKGIATNANGSWYFSGGKVNFGYTGNVQWSGLNCYISNGRLMPVSTNSNIYARAQSAHSDTDWLIVTDTQSCRVAVFYGGDGHWTAVKYLACSPGKSSTPTVTGNFKVTGRGKSFGTDTYTCWYYTQFYGDYLFHSVIYNHGSMTSIQDGRLGMKLSHGCVRLDINEAKWIYDHIPNGSRVIVF